ncbi:MAG: polysaccharide deacetylase family protein [Lautropia sp.]
MNLVLCYHHVSPTRTLFSTSPQVFARHLEVLREAGYAMLSHDEFVEHARSRFASRARTALVTFDDGHADTWFHARAVLDSLSVPAVMFAITSVVADGPVRSAAEEPVIGDTPQAEEALIPIRWAELLAWQAGGRLSVQTHTHRHREMRGFAGTPAEQEALIGQDLDEACAVLREKIGYSPTSVAWPWGYGTAAMRRAASARGLHLQFSVTPGFNGAWSSNARLHRVCVDGASVEEVSGWATRFRHGSLAASYSTARRLYNALKFRMPLSPPPPTDLAR